MRRVGAGPATPRRRVAGPAIPRRVRGGPRWAQRSRDLDRATEIRNRSRWMDPIPPGSPRRPPAATAPVRFPPPPGGGRRLPGQTVENTPARAVARQRRRCPSCHEPAPADRSRPVRLDGAATRRCRRHSQDGDHWFDHGRQIPGYVADALVMLCGSDAVALAELDGSGMQPLQRVDAAPADAGDGAAVASPASCGTRSSPRCATHPSRRCWIPVGRLVPSVPVGVIGHHERCRYGRQDEQRT